MIVKVSRSGETIDDVMAENEVGTIREDVEADTWSGQIFQDSDCPDSCKGKMSPWSHWSHWS
jgi:hypothetical protein